MKTRDLLACVYDDYWILIRGGPNQICDRALFMKHVIIKERIMRIKCIKCMVELDMEDFLRAMQTNNTAQSNNLLVMVQCPMRNKSI